MSNVGDLGRRVGERRRELKLTPEAVALRAGMDPSYYRTIESSPSPELSRAAMARLAVALETTVGAITGSGTEAPPGPSNPTARLALDSLDQDECAALISPGGVGRVVFVEPRGAVAIPVNFRTLGGDVVFRTALMPTLTPAIELGPVSFEVDHIDDALSEGWSVLLSGRAHVVVDPNERQQVEDLGVVPWAGGERDVFVRIVPGDVTGRRIRRH